MVSKKSRTAVRENKHRRMRHHLAGTAQRPRLAVFRSNNHMYAQIIDDTVGNTLVSASTLDKELKAATSIPLTALITITPVSTTFSAEITPPTKSSAPGVSMKLSLCSFHSVYNTAGNTDDPYSCSTGR